MSMKDNWKYILFEDCLQKVKYTNKVLSSDYLKKGTYPIISQEEAFVSGYWNNEDDVFRVQKPVVIFGDHTRVLKYVDFDFVIGADGVKVLLPKDALNTKFLKYYLYWYNIPNLGYSRHYKLLKELYIPVPTLSIQEVIVAELDKLNEILTKKHEQLKELDRLGQALFYDMFGDPSVNNKKWEMSTIGDIAISVTYGTSKPASEFGKYPYLRMNNITYTGSLDLSNLKYIDLSDLEVEKFLVKKGDILFNRTNSKDLVGKTTYFPYNMPMVIAGYLIRVRLKEYMDSIFVSYYMNTYYIKTYLKGLCKSIIGMANINAKELQRIPIFLPPLTQQSLFAQKINALESQKQKIKQSIVEVQQLLDYTMNKYFG